jgi:mannose-6-phosphate isomerase-like protein (cupin superfamily)
MTPFALKHLPPTHDVIAPDGSEVRVLLALDGGSMAHFALAPGQVSTAVTHRTVEEIWFFLGGQGEFWRKQGAQEEIIRVEAGVCITIPVGTHFQFRAFGSEPLTMVGVTMPPWPGDGEAVVVPGPWTPTVSGAGAQTASPRRPSDQAAQSGTLKLQSVASLVPAACARGTREATALAVSACDDAVAEFSARF